MLYQSVQLFKKHLQNSFPNDFSKIYLVIVSNDFERNNLMNLIKNSIPHENDFFVYKTSCDKALIKDVINHLETPSLLGGEPFVILDKVDQLNKNDINLFTSYFAWKKLYNLILGSKI